MRPPRGGGRARPEAGLKSHKRRQISVCGPQRLARRSPFPMGEGKGLCAKGALDAVSYVAFRNLKSNVLNLRTLTG